MTLDTGEKELTLLMSAATSSFLVSFLTIKEYKGLTNPIHSSIFE